MNYEYDKVYVNNVPFPYTPVHDAEQNDLDLDPWTNTKGYLNRNRVREDVKVLNFNIETMSGQEMKDLMEMRKPMWFQCKFFDEVEWEMVDKTMYCSSPKYKKYYIDKYDPLKNIYTNITFSFIER